MPTVAAILPIPNTGFCDVIWYQGSLFQRIRVLKRSGLAVGQAVTVDGDKFTIGDHIWEKAGGAFDYVGPKVYKIVSSERVIFINEVSYSVPAHWDTTVLANLEVTKQGWDWVHGADKLLSLEGIWTPYAESMIRQLMSFKIDYYQKLSEELAREHAAIQASIIFARM